MLLFCGKEIAAGRANNAETVAKRYVKQIDSSKHLDLRERYKRYSYAWYVLCHAAYRVCLQSEATEIAPRLVDFFAAHKISTWYFLKYVQSLERGNRLSARESGLRADLDKLHDRVYDTWDKAIAMRADLKANSRVVV